MLCFLRDPTIMRLSCDGTALAGEDLRSLPAQMHLTQPIVGFRPPQRGEAGFGHPPDGQQRFVIDIARIDAAVPFNQALSDAIEPIRVVRTQTGELHIMQGNHRIFGAIERELRTVQAIIYTPQQWEEFSGLRFNPAQGIPGPAIGP